MTTLVFALVFSLVAQATELSSTEPAKLVQQLGAEDFAARETASQALLKLGVAAMPAVEGGARSPDPEIAQRCGDLLLKLRKLQLLEQLDAVRNGNEEIELPLLKLYRNSVSADREAFELYASAAVADPELLIQTATNLADKKADATARIIEKRIEALVAEFAAISTPRGMEQDTLAQSFPERVVAVIMVAGLAKVEVSAVAWESFPRVLIFSLAFRDRIKADNARGEALRKLLEQWCLTARSETALTRALRQMLLYERREAAAILARRVLDGEGRFNDVLRATAADALGRYGTVKEDLPRIVSLLDDQAEFWAGSPAFLGREVGDVAALSIVRMTGQKSQDYGINEAAIELSIGAVFAPGGGLAQALRCPIPGFDTDESRQLGQNKLRKWLVDNKATDKDLLNSPAPSNPAEFLAHARRSAEDKVCGGRRWKLWTNGAANPDALEPSLLDGKIRLLGGRFFEPGLEGSTSGGTYESPLGRAFILQVSGRSPKVSIYAVDVSSDDQVISTEVNCASTNVLRFVRKEVTGDTTTEIDYDQRDDKVSAKIKRTANLDGTVLLDETVSAEDLIALRDNKPSAFAIGLEPILRTLRIELPLEK